MLEDQVKGVEEIFKVCFLKVEIFFIIGFNSVIIGKEGS